MIVGLLTLFTVLFFGGSTEYYFVTKLEKGVKTYVEDKATRKDILNDLKTIKGEVKQFNKNRKSELKTLKAMNADYESITADFESFFAKLVKERQGFQSKMIDQRLNTVAKISDEQWTQIIALSDEKVEKAITKKTKKKEKDKFEKLEKTLRSNITNEERLNEALNAFNTLKSTFQSLETELAKVNSKQNKSITNKNFVLKIFTISQKS